MKKIFSFLILMLLLVACSTKYTTIDSNEAMELIDSGAVIIDVREEDEYNHGGHIKNSINIPLGNISSIDYSKDTVIIVYCQSGIRSQEAAKKLYDLGYTSIYNLDGGLINWGFELEE